MNLMSPACHPPPWCFFRPHRNDREQYEIRADFYFIKITSYTDKMIRALQTKVSALHHQNARGDEKREIMLHDLGNDDNKFLKVVVESVKHSIDLQIEEFNF